ncbi:hypothetical protein V2G26_011818 [Clonostachys chloroleuca]
MRPSQILGGWPTNIADTLGPERACSTKLAPSYWAMKLDTIFRSGPLVSFKTSKISHCMTKEAQQRFAAVILGGPTGYQFVDTSGSSDVIPSKWKRADHG